MRALFEKAHINMKMLTLLSKAFPALGESTKDLEDPMRLHESVHSIVVLFTKGLEADHASGYFTKDELISPVTTEVREEGTESLLSGSNGHGQIDLDGSLDGGISSSLLGTEIASEVPDLRHEAEVQGREGA